MADPMELMANLNAGVVIMPTNFDLIKQHLASISGIFNTDKTGAASTVGVKLQGSVSVSDAQTSVTMSFLTNREQLQAMLPSGKNLEVSAPIVTLSMVYQGGIKWLAGRSYNILMVMFPVIHSGKNGKTYGQFLPVVWENMTEPIMGGREGIGWPKIYADLPPARKYNDTFACIAHWYGFTFVEMNVTGIHALTPEELQKKAEAVKKQPPSSGLICHKFILKTGTLSETDADYLTISTSQGAPSVNIRETLTGKSSLRLIKGNFQQLPTMGHIVERLADLEIKELYDATIVTQLSGGMGAVKILE